MSTPEPNKIIFSMVKVVILLFLGTNQPHWRGMDRIAKNLFLIIFLAVGTASAQTAKFDIVSYTPPAGWQVEKDANSVRYSKAVGDTYCMISVTRSLESADDPAKNFDNVWTVLAVDGLNAAPPQQRASEVKGGWKAEVGVGTFKKDGTDGVVLVTAFSGNGRVVAAMAITNSDTFQSDIQKFADSIKLPPIVAQRAAPSASTAPSSISGTAVQSPGGEVKLVGRWQRSGSSSPSYADPASWGTGGYTKSRYEFLPNGTYVYTERAFSYVYSNIIIIRENGRYTVDGSTLTISPAKSTVSAYKKVGGDTLGAVVSTQNRRLETVSYRFTFHYFSGIQEWNLVLQADSPTERDGKFSTLAAFSNAWYFDQKFVNTDLTANRVQ
jgi:hypothetical protein